MGQAVDLPDPLEAAPPAGQGADDLLSQLAGDEIDRLLAEAEVEKGAAAPLDAAGTALPPLDEIPATDTNTDTTVAAAIDAAQAKDSAADTSAIASSADTTTPAAAPVPSGAAVAAALAAVTTAVSADYAVAPADVNSIEEHEALLAPDPSETDSAPLPIWLRPLEWLNAPLQTLPEPTRNFLGKAAILTVINSAAVIAYVLMVRKH